MQKLGLFNKRVFPRDLIFLEILDLDGVLVAVLLDGGQRNVLETGHIFEVAALHHLTHRPPLLGRDLEHPANHHHEGTSQMNSVHEVLEEEEGGLGLEFGHRGVFPVYGFLLQLRPVELHEVVDKALVAGRRVEQGFPQHYLDKNVSQTPHIALDSVALVNLQNLLGRPIERSRTHPLELGVFVLQLQGKPQIGDSDVALVAVEDVGSFEVSVEDLLFVEFTNSLGHSMEEDFELSVGEADLLLDNAVEIVLEVIEDQYDPPLAVLGEREANVANGDDVFGGDLPEIDDFVVGGVRDLVSLLPRDSPT